MFVHILTYFYNSFTAELNGKLATKIIYHVSHHTLNLSLPYLGKKSQLAKFWCFDTVAPLWCQCSHMCRCLPAKCTVCGL